jgi:hypothetical protein
MTDTDALTLDKMTVPQMKTLADKLGVAYASKVKKDELKATLTEHITTMIEQQTKKRLKKQRQSNPTPLPNSERVQKYVRVNGTKKLTVAQWRKVRRSMRKPGDDGSLVVTDRMSLLRGHSLLALTPNGQGIFHKFAE